MSILSFLYKNGVWISVPLFGIGVFLLWFFILTVVRLGDKNRICSVPLRAEQDVEFTEAGRVVLWVEGPLLSTRFSGLTYELTGSDGSSTTGRKNLFPVSSSSFSRGRKVERIFTILHPGRYVLHTRGLGDPQAADEKHKLIFIRPYLPQTIACILGIILGAFLTIGSLVLFSLRFTSKGDGA